MKAKVWPVTVPGWWNRSMQPIIRPAFRAYDNTRAIQASMHQVRAARFAIEQGLLHVEAQDELDDEPLMAAAAATSKSSAEEEDDEGIALRPCLRVPLPPATASSSSTEVLLVPDEMQYVLTRQNIEYKIKMESRARKRKRRDTPQSDSPLSIASTALTPAPSKAELRAEAKAAKQAAKEAAKAAAKEAGVEEEEEEEGMGENETQAPKVGRGLTPYQTEWRSYDIDGATGKVALPFGLTIGGECIALGLYGGERIKYRAMLLNVRERFPPLKVKYTATLEGEKTKLLLPNTLVAHLDLSEVEPVEGAVPKVEVVLAKEEEEEAEAAVEAAVEAMVEATAAGT